MKTAMSLPDDLFRAAERYAKRSGVSRSQLYATALKEYLGSQYRNDVKEALNRVYAEESSTADPVFDRMRRASIAEEKW
jgi:metal-responsive CopG/Arc/MetJ family transcriptional regulator